MTIACDYESGSVYSATTVRAAKDHRCCECTGTIRKGERHERVNGCWEGSWSTYRTCPDCVALRCDLLRTYGENGCNGWLHEGMRDFIEGIVDSRWKGWDRVLAAFNATAVPRGAPAIIDRFAEDDEPTKPSGPAAPKETSP